MQKISLSCGVWFQTTSGPQSWRKPKSKRAKRYKRCPGPRRPSHREMFPSPQHPQSPRFLPLSHPLRKVRYPSKRKPWPPPAQHHYPAHSLCSGQPTPAVSAKPIFMGCSRRPWPTHQSHRHLIRTFDAKSWGFDQKYGCSRKLCSRGWQA